mgnify:CR=1 FL=1|jgi:hypothetical protein
MSAAPDITPDPVAVPASLLGTLRALARRELCLAVGAGAARILALLLALGLARCLFDLWVQLDWVVRLVFLLIDLALAVWLARRWCWSAWRRRLDIPRAALRLERVFPALGTRLIAAVQLPAQISRDNLSPELVAGIVSEADSVLATLPWREAAPARPALRAFAALAAVLVVAGGLAALNPEGAGILARRWLLSTEPALTRTRLALAQQDLRVAIGSPVRLEATATGVVPRRAVFEIRPEKGAAREFPVDASIETPGAFALTIASAREGFRYRVRAGDARSAWHEVEVLPAPTARDLVWTLRPPAYTGLSERALEPDGEIIAPEGSTLLVRGMSALPLRSAALARWPALDAKEGAVSTTLTLKPDGLSFSGEATLAPPAAALSLPLVSRDGVPSQDDTRRPVRILPDAAPVINLRAAPADEDSATAADALLVAGVVEDDYGLGTLTLHWEIAIAAGAPQTGLKPLEIRSTGPAARRADFAIRLAIGSAEVDDPALAPVPAPSGAKLTWWIEATDNAPAPHRQSTPRRTVRIVTPDEKLSELMTRLREGMGALDDVSRSIERANDRLRPLLPAAPPPAPAP